MNRWGCCLWLLMVCADATPASAHALSRSQSWWQVHERQVDVQVRLPWLEVNRQFQPVSPGHPRTGHVTERLRSFLSEKIPSQLRLKDPGAHCRQTTKPSIRPAESNGLLMAWRLECERPPSSTVAVDLFFDGAPSHLHLLTLEDANGRYDDILHAEKREVAFDVVAAGPAPPRLSMWGQVRRGALHVWEGLDHLAFVIVLMLLGGRLFTLFWIATGFTFGHMLTLTLAALGVVEVETSSVEVLVGLSITYGALTCFVQWFPTHRTWQIMALNLGLHASLVAFVMFARSDLSVSLLTASAVFTSCHLSLHSKPGDQTRSRMLLAGLFGLIHGLAFASGFAELVVEEELLTSLLCFNLGVEFAHVLVIACVGFFWLSIRRALEPHAQLWILASTGALLFTCGLVWTVERALL